MVKHLLPAFGFFLLATGLGFGQDAAKKELAALEGTWKFQKLDIPDEGPRKDFEKHGRVIIKGDKATFMRADEKFAEFTIKVDPSKSPKTADVTIDFIVAEKGAKDASVGKKVLVIYELDGDTLRFFFAGKAKDRPKKFPEGPNQGVVTMKRVKVK
jgi:uncharacterized protein (TIGR03067 family)